MKKTILLSLLACAGLTSCEINDFFSSGRGNNNGRNSVELKDHSITPNFLDLKPGFKNLSVNVLLSSEDVLENSPNFIYGSMADGAGLLKNNDGTFTLINNIEADYSVARITLDKTFKPVAGEYILNATATANTAQCSGTLITPEEHGFGPLWLSAGEWGGSRQGVYSVDPFKNTNDASSFEMLTALGQWATENAVPLNKDAYPGKTVVIIGEDASDDNTPKGQIAMYVGNRGDLYGGKLYGLKVTSPGINYEVDMKEGQSYNVEFVEYSERTLDELQLESEAKGIMGFSRVEDIDWRRGSAENNRELYVAVTGRKKAGLVGKGTTYGRIYQIKLDKNNPLKGKISCVLDGDILDGKAKAFHSPDNVLVTENYVYIQEDPNGYPDTPEKAHYAYLYQYNIKSKNLKVVLECDQNNAAALGYGTTSNSWELTGMIDVSETLDKDKTFLLITQNHGWQPADGSAFTDPTANSNVLNSTKEGSTLFVIKGLEK
ncbi:phosphatase [Mariniflexile gromovii]|uniref:Phosphatase n=1 Tax=Mariniflexile gromovii TaxID=362523 RepID=A0ABS4BVH8_9FLAO|nr:phosphatase [Mariniflexile gromovii]MBP0904592.1 phosphatase [Mariniflexile gromovii]